MFTSLPPGDATSVSAATPTPSETTWPKVTINILAYNRQHEVRQTLRELEKVDYPREQLEIIVVDNASTDGTKEMVEAEFPYVRLIVLYPNRAVAGWNAGFEAGTGDYFLVLDDDSALESGLKEGIAYLQENPQIGIVACNIVGGSYTTEMLQDKQEFIAFVGCGALLRREMVEKIGGYADWIYLYGLEWEYALRCSNAGYEVRYLEGCVVRHRSSPLNRSNKRLRMYSTRNEMLIVHLYLSKQRTLLLARTLFYNAICIRSEGWRSLLWVLRGFVMFLRDAPRLKQNFVRPEVEQRYVKLNWSTQPVSATIARFVRQGLMRLRG